MITLHYAANCWTCIKTQYQQDRPSTTIITESVKLIDRAFFIIKVPVRLDFPPYVISSVLEAADVDGILMSG